MFKKLIFSVLTVFILSSFTFSQHANYQLAERFTTEKMSKIVGSTSVRPNWLKDLNIFWYSYKTSDGTNYYIVDPDKKSKIPLFDNISMATALTRLSNKPFNEKDLQLKNIKFKKNKKEFTFEVDSLYFKYSLSSKIVTLLDTLDSDSLKHLSRTRRWASFSPDSTWIIFAKNHNLYLMKPKDKDSTEIQLTTDGEKWYSYAADDNDTSTIKRVRSRARWFKDSKKIFFVKQDRRKVGDLFVINSLKKPRPTLETYKYSVPGEKEIAQDELIVIDIATKELVTIDVKKWKDQSIGGVYFGRGSGLFTKHKTSDKIYFIRRDRTWSKIDACVADTKTGEAKVLIHEESKPYFNTRYSNLIVLNGGKDLVWWSERDGWGHLYHYDGNGKLLNRMTKGSFVVGDVTAIDSTTNTLYFSAFGKEKNVDPYYTLYYKVDMNGRNFKLLTPENATHSFSMAEKDRNYFVNTFSRVDQVPKSILRDKNGKIVLELETTDISRLLEIGWKMPEKFKVKAADYVTDVYGVMWKPFDFDSTKKYPIIAYCYPGPQTEPFPLPFTITGSRGRNAALAQLGFVVVAVGNRGGSPQRSKYYHNWGYGNNRDYPLDDNKAALEQLADRHSFIDINKVGIYGHSGGGNMSTAAMLKYPDFYKVAVSSAGNHDNNIYNIWWGEVHYGVKEVKKKKGKSKDKEKDKEAAEEDTTKKEEITFQTKIQNNQSLAKNLKGHLLLVHGDVDNNVHPANTIRVVDALIKAGKRFDFMIMPGKRHGFGDYSKYFERMMWYYFAEHLLGDYKTNIEIYNYN